MKNRMVEVTLELEFSPEGRREGKKQPGQIDG